MQEEVTIRYFEPTSEGEGRADQQGTLGEDPQIILRRYFDLPELTSREDQDKLAQIDTYLKEIAKEQDAPSLMWALRNIELSLSAPPLGKTRFAHVWEFIKTDSLARRYDAERRQLMR